jgi:hypothetical protein
MKETGFNSPRGLLRECCSCLFPALVDVTNVPEEESAVDIFAIGFEEIVDLNASNIMAAR